MPQLRIFIALLIFASPAISFADAEKNTAADYIELWHEEAVRQMVKYNIPASITLAQGLLESGNGNSRLAVQGNNHFGIKCHSDWNGATIREDDETKQECFRKYKSAEESFEDHSIFLNKKRYEPLFQLKIDDYKGWAHGLKKCGYATNPKYPHLLIDIIERYDLTQYDKEGLKHIKNNTSPSGNNKKPKENPKKETGKASGKNNGVDSRKEINLSNNRSINLSKNRVKYVVANEGDTPESIAQDLDMSTWQIKKYNDLHIGHIEPGDIIYIQPKRNKGIDSQYTVKAGDTLWKISQAQGIKLKKLLKLNDWEVDKPISIGQKLKLK